jgi:hypothetical protein
MDITNGTYNYTISILQLTQLLSYNNTMLITYVKKWCTRYLLGHHFVDSGCFQYRAKVCLRKTW